MPYLTFLRILFCFCFKNHFRPDHFIFKSESYLLSFYSHHLRVNDLLTHSCPCWKGGWYRWTWRVAGGCRRSPRFSQKPEVSGFPQWNEPPPAITGHAPSRALSGLDGPPRPGDTRDVPVMCVEGRSPAQMTSPCSFFFFLIKIFFNLFFFWLRWVFVAA